MKQKYTNKHAKKPKSFLTIVYETYKDFAENTSIHGLKYTVKPDIGTPERIFWALIFFGGLISAIYMTFLFWERYVSNPTRATIKTYYAPTSSIPFPAVSICNVNTILETKLQVFIDSLNIDESDKPGIREALPQLLGFTDPNSVEYNETLIETVQELLKVHQYNVSSVMQKLSQNCTEMLRFCSWNGIQMDCHKLFIESLTVNGYCCSFNYGQSTESLYTPYNGVNTGIVAILDPMPQTVQYSSLHFSGFKVIINDPTEYPGSQSTTKMVSLGNIAFLHLFGSKMTCSDAVQLLPINHRDCVFSEEYHLDSFEEYSDSSCLSECEAKYFYKICKCVPYYYNFLKKLECTASQLACLLAVRKSDLDFMAMCGCPSQCEDDFYNIFATQTTFDLNRSNSMWSFENVTTDDSSVLLNVFFSEQNQCVYLRDTIFSTVYLLSSFGGVYSLFLGCSLITVIEVFYYFTVRLTVNMKIFEKATIPSEVTKKTKIPSLSQYIPPADNFTMEFLP